jgi:hypothetical protein
MKHFWALLIKFAAIGTVLFSLLGIFDISIITIFLMALITTLVAYFIGDLFILRRMGNIAAIIGDLGLSFGLVWLLSSLLINGTFNIILVSLFSALVITAIEALFHVYIRNHIFKDSGSYIPTVNRHNQFATEFAEEENPIHNNFAKNNGEKKEK